MNTHALIRRRFRTTRIKALTVLLAAATVSHATASHAGADPARSSAPPGESSMPPGACARPHLIARIGESVRAGDSIVLEWTGMDPAVDELEIQLSLDGGRHFAVRVSPELDARAGRYVWRVPNLACADARLRLRFCREGREIEGESLAAFRIAARPMEAAELSQVSEGGWWNGVRDAGPGAADESLASGGLRWNADGDGQTIGIVTRVATPREIARAIPFTFESWSFDSRSPAPRTDSAPRVVPQRN
ncbi:MAG: hypothetical protein HYR73_06785 [Candidatus Eisenbacteria bacterium]|nr:hypothetical protein [Candidatus Eisenbacteria bacterium]